jgi:phosphate transport system substrate-binding protein
MISAYKVENPKVKISLYPGGSSRGIKALIEKDAHIATSIREINKSEMKEAQENGATLIPNIVAYDALVPIVHPSNPLNNLTTKQLNLIYLKKIANWKELGGNGLNIDVVSRDDSSGSYEAWRNLILNEA